MDDTLQMSVNDKRVIDLWDSTLQFRDGHYCLPIPFKSDVPTMPDNMCVAEARLESLARKLTKNKDLHEKYATGMQDLLDKGYAERVVQDERESKTDGGPVWYIPHHGVTSEKKPDKLRIVFDCAAKYGGTNLNNEVLQGPDLTNKLIGVLLRFRQEKVAIMGDIEAMYHQVKVDVRHRDALRFLWWPKGDMARQPEIYRMTVHLFGGVWSPSCANYALHRAAEENSDSFDSETIQTVLNNMYVDDCLKSLPSESEAIHLVKELCELLQRGGFNITKWVSNSRTVLESIPADKKAKNVKDIDLGCSVLPQERALGVSWYTETDTFGFTVKPKQKPHTRRGLISVICSLYDPFGFVCPVILKAKALFQSECRRGKGWDEPLEPDIERKWIGWIHTLSEIENLGIPRCLSPPGFGMITRCELHHFSDASMCGYGAVSYIRLVSSDDQIHCAFLMGKSRLSPMKSVTIPRLELSAAVLSVKLDQTLRRELSLNIDKSTFWVDSMIVLHYIKSCTQRLQTFVANRVSIIHEGSSPDDWRHVESKLNPADVASRGIDASEIVTERLWIQGPGFLCKEEMEWPASPVTFDVSETDLEVRKTKAFLVSTTCVEGATDILLEMYSSWYRLKRTVSWILRLKHCLLSRVRGQKSTVVSMDSLTVTEIRTAELEIVKFLQRRHFSEELKQAKRDEPIKKSSSIYSLEPVLNSGGILCVRGRLSNAPIAEAAKHQMILPKNNHVVKLIGRHYHEQLAHSGIEHVLSRMRQHLWIIGARSMLKGILRSCVHCRRIHGSPCGQKMSDLPVDRVSPHQPPFTFVGVDCFGPFEIKRGRSLVKRYGCLFTCLATRAIHIETLDSMDTDSFINALRRFESRRGKPEKIRSDNGTNFRGAFRELKEAIKSWNQTKIHDYLTHRDIQWQFNPPTASHMGGVWERQIRTVRKVLAGLLINEKGLNEDGLNTLFCEVEAIVNSRPITFVSGNVCDDEPLTPNHLLLLRSSVPLPPGKFEQRDIYRRRWKHVQFLADNFWRRWVLEYLPNLQLRQKWLKEKPNLKDGDIVLIIDENMPRRMWPLGRVLKTFQGKDGLVRSVELTTRGTTLTRPVHKLCWLESVTE